LGVKGKGTPFFRSGSDSPKTRKRNIKIEPDGKPLKFRMTTGKTAAVAIHELFLKWMARQCVSNPEKRIIAQSQGNKERPNTVYSYLLAYALRRGCRSKSGPKKAFIIFHFLKWHIILA
jgi:hypothetical protein